MRIKYIGTLTAICLLIALAGCASNDWVAVRATPQNPLAERLRLMSRRGPRPTERTEQLLRKYDLPDLTNTKPNKLLARLQRLLVNEPDPEKMYSFAELAYLAGRKLEHAGKPQAVDLYLASASHAYLYLFDQRFYPGRNPYDPQFRGASELYNTSLESALRILKKQGPLRPGQAYALETPGQTFRLTVVSRSRRWQAGDVDRIEFVSDYEVKGLNNRYRTFGLGVPMIMCRETQPSGDPAARFYPPGFSFPVTAFLRLLPQATSTSGVPQACEAVLEYHDPMESTETVVADRLVPLETDISTPLAYFLNNPELRELDLSTVGLLDPNSELFQTKQGLYMLEPYDANKIPVLMVHGLWSSPITWMEMFNDLRGSPEIRRRYQFWFYLYPTGQPYLRSASQLREELAQLRTSVDPHGRNALLDQMVLVGHSMGGLISRLQTVESGDSYWRLVSDKPIESLDLDDNTHRALAASFFFHANPAVRRTITIATPYLGSHVSNSATRWLARKFISVPDILVNAHTQILAKQPAEGLDADLANVPTSVDSLTPDSPILAALRASPTSGRVLFHNIVGVSPKKGLLGRVAATGDGIVSIESARATAAVSEVVVPADHMNVHRHPRTVLEVRRILLEHLAEADYVARRPDSQAGLPAVRGLPNVP